jgi:hypothetical protein
VTASCSGPRSPGTRGGRRCRDRPAPASGGPRHAVQECGPQVRFKNAVAGEAIEPYARLLGRCARDLSVSGGDKPLPESPPRERPRRADTGGVKARQWRGFAFGKTPGCLPWRSPRRFGFIDGNARREAARGFGLDRETMAKMPAAGPHFAFWIRVTAIEPLMRSAENRTFSPGLRPLSRAGSWTR